MYEWPILLGLSLGKSIYSDYRSSSCILLILAFLSRPRGWLATGIGLPILFHLPTYTDSWNKDFIFRYRSEKMVGSEAARWRRRKEICNASCVADFFHCDFNRPLCWFYRSESSFLIYETRKTLSEIRAKGKFRRFLWVINIFLNTLRNQNNRQINTSKKIIIRNIIINLQYNIIM